MTEARAALAAATRRLAAAGIEDPGRDARRLLAHAMKVPPGRLTLMLAEPLAGPMAADFEALVARRAARVPVSQLIGRRAFYGREFLVTGEVLDPRPETETLIEAALAAPFSTVLDLGTGSGCILLTLLAEALAMGRPARGVGVERSPAAFEVAFWNRNAMGLTESATLLQGSWFEPLAGHPEAAAGFDLIVSNPPYVTEAEWHDLAPEVRDHEPLEALVAGPDGLDAYRAILSDAAAFLRPGGRLLFEIGHRQGRAVAGLVEAAGLGPARVVQDMGGADRVVIGQSPGGRG